MRVVVVVESLLWSCLKSSFTIYIYDFFTISRFTIYDFKVYDLRSQGLRFTVDAAFLCSVLNRAFCLNAFVYFCSRETFNALTNWLTDARTLASPNIVIVLVGNKKDLEAEREVTFLEASRFAQENGDYI